MLIAFGGHGIGCAVMRNSPLLYLPSACLAAVYWGLAGWACQAATGHDPLDLLTASGAGAGAVVAATVVLMAFVALYAVIGVVAARWRATGKATDG